jgi:hypothetical protein
MYVAVGNVSPTLEQADGHHTPFCTPAQKPKRDKCIKVL